MHCCYNNILLGRKANAHACNWQGYEDVGNKPGLQCTGAESAYRLEVCVAEASLAGNALVPAGVCST